MAEVRKMLAESGVPGQKIDVMIAQMEAPTGGFHTPPRCHPSVGASPSAPLIPVKQEEVDIRGRLQALELEKKHLMEELASSDAVRPVVSANSSPAGSATSSCGSEMGPPASKRARHHAGEALASKFQPSAIQMLQDVAVLKKYRHV